jgi:hypothetical protein
MKTRTLVGFVALGLGWASLSTNNPMAPVLFGAAMTLFIEELVLLCKSNP